MSEPFPDIPIWKRGERVERKAREFGALFDCARTTGEPAVRASLVEQARALGEQLVDEITKLVALLTLAKAHPPPPKAPPARPFHESEDPS